MILAVSVICFHPFALAAGKFPEADAYNERLRKIADKALYSTLMKHLDRLNGVKMKIDYAVDRDGHVHNVKVTSETHDRSAEQIVADAYNAITFPPIPMAAQLEVGAGYFDQSHLIREFRQFAGIAPGAYAPVSADQPSHVALVR